MCCLPLRRWPRERAFGAEACWARNLRLPCRPCLCYGMRNADSVARCAPAFERHRICYEMRCLTHQREPTASMSASIKKVAVSHA